MTGVTTPGYRASLLVNEMRKEYAETKDKYLSQDYVAGNNTITIYYNCERDFAKISVRTNGYPNWVYQYFHTEQNISFDTNTTTCVDAVDVSNAANTIAATNRLYRASQRKFDTTIMMADLRKQVTDLIANGQVTKEAIAGWNEEAREMGLFGANGMLHLNQKKAKMLRAWFAGKLRGLSPKQESAEQVVRVLLDDEEPEDDSTFTISPAELTRAIGLNYSDDEFIFDCHQDRFAGRYPTGYWRYYVSWKKLLRKGKPVYLGSIRQVERPYNNHYSPVAHEGEWYIDSVPTKTVDRTPRGARMKPGQETKHFKTHAGYGAVRFRQMPVTYTKYFRTRAEAAGYLASMIVPHRHLKVVESQVSRFVDYLRTAHLREPTERDFVYKDASNPKTRHLEDEEYRTFNVYAKRAADKDGMIPFIGQISVAHYSSGTPFWCIDAIFGLSWPGPAQNINFRSRFKAAAVLWQFYRERMKLNKPVFP